VVESEVEQVLDAVGPRLRALRRRGGVTLADLPADETAVELLIFFDRQGERVHVRARSGG
jgi:hypothetical protein